MLLLDGDGEREGGSEQGAAVCQLAVGAGEKAERAVAGVVEEERRRRAIRSALHQHAARARRLQSADVQAFGQQRLDCRQRIAE